jgi:hypothetical protein
MPGMVKHKRGGGCTVFSEIILKVEAKNRLEEHGDGSVASFWRKKEAREPSPRFPYAEWEHS